MTPDYNSRLGHGTDQGKWLMQEVKINSNRAKKIKTLWAHHDLLNTYLNTPICIDSSLVMRGSIFSKLWMWIRKFFEKKKNRVTVRLSKKDYYYSINNMFLLVLLLLTTSQVLTKDLKKPTLVTHEKIMIGSMANQVKDDTNYIMDFIETILPLISDKYPKAITFVATYLQALMKNRSHEDVVNMMDFSNIGKSIRKTLKNLPKDMHEKLNFDNDELESYKSMLLKLTQNLAA